MGIRSSTPTAPPPRAETRPVRGGNAGACLLAVVLALLAAFAVVPRQAAGSMLLDRNATNVSLKVNAGNVALVEYDDAAGVRHHVLAWGARNGTLRFSIDRSGGWKSHKADWKHFSDGCYQYEGPQLPFVADSCTVADGSHWVLQSWARVVSNYGGTTGPNELRLSHFTGAPAQLAIATDWAGSGRYLHLYGTYTYGGVPVYGHSVTPTGYVLDGLGRNVGIDSWNSDYPGTQNRWARVNAFLANYPNGQFCFSFSPKPDAIGPLAQQGQLYTGRSSSGWYRASVAGPGVSPDVAGVFRERGGAYDPAWDAQANAVQAQLAAGTTGGSCTNRN